MIRRIIDISLHEDPIDFKKVAVAGNVAINSGEHRACPPCAGASPVGFGDLAETSFC